MHQNNVRAWQEQNSDFKRKNAELQLRSDQTNLQVAEVRRPLLASAFPSLLLTLPIPHSSLPV